MTAQRDSPAFGFSAFADEASVRICGSFLVAVRRMSSKQPFDSADLVQTETVNSLQLDPTTQTRILLYFAFISRTSAF
ncbi:MAG: hypothetical protein AAFO86_14705, partial [Pseudomonadota bacterium]